MFTNIIARITGKKEVTNIEVDPQRIDIDSIIKQVENSSNGAKTTLMHRLLYVMPTSVVEAVLQKCLWRLHSLQATKRGAEAAVMAVYNSYKQ